MGLEPDRFYLLDGIYPKDNIVNHSPKAVTKEEFLNTIVIKHDGISYNVNQVIETVTKVLGARHAGKPWKEHENILAEETSKIGGIHSTM